MRMRDEFPPLTSALNQSRDRKGAFGNLWRSLGSNGELATGSLTIAAR